MNKEKENWFSKAWWAINDAFWLVYDKFARYIKYSLVGLIGAGIHFALLYVLTDKVGLWYLLSATIAILVAGTNNYILNYKWTFKDKKQNNRNVMGGWAKFILTIGGTEAIYLGLVALFTEKAGLHYMLSAFLSLSLTTVLRYFSADKWVWGDKQMTMVRFKVFLKYRERAKKVGEKRCI